nr:MAG TPA: hypothetical protein [Caudoviricetes sp.]
MNNEKRRRKLPALEEANNEIGSLTQQLGEAVETIYQADMDTIG